MYVFNWIINHQNQGGIIFEVSQLIITSFTGRALNHLGRSDEAETAYRIAKRLLPWGKPGDKSGVARIAPNSLNLFLNLGNLISRNGSRLEEADRLYRQAIAMRSDYIQVGDYP